MAVNRPMSRPASTAAVLFKSAALCAVLLVAASVSPHRHISLQRRPRLFLRLPLTRLLTHTGMLHTQVCCSSSCTRGASPQLHSLISRHCQHAPSNATLHHAANHLNHHVAPRRCIPLVTPYGVSLHQPPPSHARAQPLDSSCVHFTVDCSSLDLPECTTRSRSAGQPPHPLCLPPTSRWMTPRAMISSYKTMILPARTQPVRASCPRSTRTCGRHTTSRARRWRTTERRRRELPLHSPCLLMSLQLPPPRPPALPASHPPSATSVSTPMRPSFPT